MTDIVAANVTYSFDPKDASFQGRAGKRFRGTISFGNGALTYPTGGIPLTKGKMGCPNVIKSVDIYEGNAKGYLFEYDVSAEKIRIFQAGAVTIAGTVAAPVINLVSNSGNVAADKVIGLNALSNGAALVGNAAIVNVIGVQAPAFTGSNVSAAGFSELTGASSVVTASVLEVEVLGY